MRTIRHIIAYHIDVDINDITSATTLSALNLDSLDVVELPRVIGREFNIDDDELLDRITFSSTVQDVVDAVDELRSE